MSERYDTGWWLVEPPDTEFDPPVSTDSPEFRRFQMYSDDDDLWDERQYQDETWLEDSRRHELVLQAPGDSLDGTQPAILFANVRVDDDGNFKVPERYIQTPDHGVWCFSAFGRKGTFKDRDKYGDIRFLRTNGEITGAIWVPHLYPFEETDSKGLPLIRDRERAELLIELNPVEGHSQDVYPSYAEITVSEQMYGAQESIEYFNGDKSKIFSEFVAVGKKLFAETVEYPEQRWESIWQYLAEMGMTQDYNAIMQLKKPVPIEYSQQHEPLDWQTRQISAYEGNAFGSIWVPVDELRRGIEATIIFPRFSEVD